MSRMPSWKMSPRVEKPRRRIRSPIAPPSPASKAMPVTLCSAAFKVSRLRSSISFSVTTVTDCGTSRSACWPLPAVVVVAW